MKQVIILILLFLNVQAIGQVGDSSVWHLSGELKDKSVKAYYVRYKNRSSRNVLVFKKGKQSDTLDLADDRTTFPIFSDTCTLEAFQLDGQGSDEIVISYKYNWANEKQSIHYTTNVIWNLDTRKNIFFATNDYNFRSKETIYKVNASGAVMDSITYVDSCLYSCNLNLKTKGVLIIENVKQNGHCPYNNLYKKEKGVFAFRNGWMVRIKEY